jgi:hypothetical protein
MLTIVTGTVGSLMVGILATAEPTVTSAAACGVSPRADIQVFAEPGPVSVGSTFSLSEIDQLARETGYGGSGPRLGFYIGRFLDNISVGLEPDLVTGCEERVRVEVHMQLSDRHIEVGRELRHRPCLFTAALEHYEKKAQADETAFARYATAFTTTLRSTPLPTVSLFLNQSLDEDARAQIEEWVTVLMNGSVEALHEERNAAQQAVDTPDELERLERACERA